MSFKDFSVAESATSKDKAAKPSAAAPASEPKGGVVGPEVAQPVTEEPSAKS